MIDSASIPNRRFYRSADNVCLGGVCGGMAEYFGFNLKVTRILAVIGFIMNPPLAALAYIAVVVLVPAQSMNAKKPKVDPEFRKSVRSAPAQTMHDVRRRFSTLDRRLAKLEKYVTSTRYNLDREFRDLDDDNRRR